MCYVIVTSRSLFWLLLTVVAHLLMLASFLSDTWLKGPLREIDEYTSKPYSSSVGIFSRCTYIKTRSNFECGPFHRDGFATNEEVFPAAWKASMFFIALGLSIMGLTVIFGLVSCCHQDCCKKSIFTLSGATQAIAGICYIMGIMLYPVAWGETRVLRLCGNDSAPFYPGSCSLGWGLYTAVIATGLTFVSACLSVPAERATSSDKVQDQIQEGHTLICLA